MIAEERSVYKWFPEAVLTQAGDLASVVEWVALEGLLKIVVNDRDFVSLSCSPLQCRDLALGFLFTEGVITSVTDVAATQFNELDGVIAITLSANVPFRVEEWFSDRTMTSGCGQGISINHLLKRKKIKPVRSRLSISRQNFMQVFNATKDYSEWYQRTGCVHLSCLHCAGSTPIIREDIGRHNCVDKVIGAGLRTGFDFSNSLLICSGRISSDMILKAGRAGIPIVASRAAPTALAISISDELNIALLGFVRGKRMNIYSRPERIRMADLTTPDGFELDDIAVSKPVTESNATKEDQ